MSGIVCSRCGVEAPGDVLGLPRGWEYYRADEAQATAQVICPDCVVKIINRALNKGIRRRRGQPESD